MISELTVEGFQQKILRFDRKYVDDWNRWLQVKAENRSEQFGSILRNWQACRPNKMRQTSAANLHEAPYIDDLMEQASHSISALAAFELNDFSKFSEDIFKHISVLWDIFENLSYTGKARKGKAGAVGISKAVLLLSDGHIGPAFDSEVRTHLGIKEITNAKQWFKAIQIVAQDIQSFEAKNNTTIKNSAPEEFKGLNIGRIYDMALGPGGK
jgi:hypothetical protein